MYLFCKSELMEPFLLPFLHFMQHPSVFQSNLLNRYKILKITSTSEAKPTMPQSPFLWFWTDSKTLLAMQLSGWIILCMLGGNVINHNYSGKRFTPEWNNDKYPTFPFIFLPALFPLNINSLRFLQSIQHF